MTLTSALPSPRKRQRQSRNAEDETTTYDERRRGSCRHPFDNKRRTASSLRGRPRKKTARARDEREEHSAGPSSVRHAPMTTVGHDCSPNAGESNGEDDDDDALLFTNGSKDYTADDADNQSSNNDACSETSDDGVDAEFELVDPSETFYHGIRRFVLETVLCGLTVKSLVNKSRHKEGKTRPHSQTAPLASRLSECICGQANVGTILSIPTEGKAASRTALGFSTILNLRQYPPEAGVMELTRSLLSAGKKRLPLPQAAIFKKLLFSEAAKGETVPVVGLLLSERLLNAPQRLGTDLLRALLQDVEWTRTAADFTKAEEEERPFYFFTHLVGLSKCFVLPPPSNDGESSNKVDTVVPQRHKRPTVVAVAKDTEENAIITLDRMRFPKFEDEVLLAHSDFYFTIPTNMRSRVPVEPNSKRLVDLQEHRLVFVLRYKNLNRVVAECRRLETAP